jgi:hypothetical protein
MDYSIINRSVCKSIDRLTLGQTWEFTLIVQARFMHQRQQLQYASIAKFSPSFKFNITHPGKFIFQHFLVNVVQVPYRSIVGHNFEDNLIFCRMEGLNFKENENQPQLLRKMEDKLNID